MSTLRVALIAAVAVPLTLSAALAAASDNAGAGGKGIWSSLTDVVAGLGLPPILTGGKPGKPPKPGKKPKPGGGSVAVPGPVAGAGLPAIVLIGGYAWLRRRRKAAGETPSPG